LLHEETILGFLRLVREKFGSPWQFCLESGLARETIDTIEERFVAAPAARASG
jgi:hypothetical protein